MLESAWAKAFEDMVQLVDRNPVPVSAQKSTPAGPSWNDAREGRIPSVIEPCAAEFERVADEVDDDLPQATGVVPEAFGDAVVHGQEKLQMLLPRAGGRVWTS